MVRRCLNNDMHVVAIDDVRLDAPRGSEAELDQLYMKILAFERDREATDAIAYRAENVRIIFNNDQNNLDGLGVGTDREYFETHEGKLINAKGVKARYIRFYSKGSTEAALNEYTEIEVHGKPAQMTSASGQ